MEKIGIVIYSSGGNYRVSFDSEVFNVKPMGIFRKNNEKILVGDMVVFEVNEGDELNVITKLLKRSNEFVRPNISNVDNAIITTSITEPKLNDYYLDKLITIFQMKNVEPIILFTKSDLGISEESQEIINEYINAGYKVIISGDSLSEDTLNQLKQWTENKLSVITGQTGVGKSTFINKLTNLNLKTGEISKALGRGKHTTRHSEVFELFPNSLVIDTPGFSSLNLEKRDFELLPHNFFNFGDLFSGCRFNDCRHINETGCNIIPNSSKRTLKNYWKLMTKSE